MKASRIIYLSAAMLLLAGCSAEQSPEQDGSLLPIVLGSTVADAPLTRAANNLNNNYLAAGQQVTVRISPTGENNYTDYTYTTAASGVMTPPEPKPYYPMTGNVNIRAYHPASATTGNTVGTFEVAAVQTEDANYIASDLLWAATDDSDNALDNLAKTASTRTLKFQHKLSKITVNATPDGEKVTIITGITLNNVKRKVTFDPSTGATALADTDNDPTTVTMSNNGSAIIPAQDISGTFITINTDAGAALYTLNTTFAAGHQYTFNITVNGAAIGTTNTITDWDDETPIAQNVAIAYPPAGALPGKFTINGSGDQVYFSKGNLQYQASTGTWRFAEHQYDYIETATGYPMDLFTWGNINNPTFDGQAYVEGTDNLSVNNSTDWGSNAISNGGNTANSGWYTLTGGNGGEWEYLFNTRTNASSLYGHGKVGEVNGMIILPDSWSLPSGLSFTAGNSDWTNSYTTEQWSQMEAAGAVFLPAAGFRSGTSVYNVGSDGYYRSSTAYGTDGAYIMYFESGDVNPANGNGRNGGFSVRLVRVAP